MHLDVPLSIIFSAEFVREGMKVSERSRVFHRILMDHLKPITQFRDGGGATEGCTSRAPFLMKEVPHALGAKFPGKHEYEDVGRVQLKCLRGEAFVLGGTREE